MMILKKVVTLVKRDLSKASFIVIIIAIIAIAIPYRSSLINSSRANKMAKENEKLKLYYETSNLLVDITDNSKKIRDRASKYGKVIDIEKASFFIKTEGIKLTLSLINDVTKETGKEITNLKIKEITKNDLIILKKKLMERKLLPQKDYDINRVFDRMQQTIEIGNNPESKELKGIGDRNLQLIWGHILISTKNKNSP